MADSEEDSDSSIPDVVALANPTIYKVKENVHRMKQKLMKSTEVHKKKSRFII